MFVLCRFLCVTRIQTCLCMRACAPYRPTLTLGQARVCAVGRPAATRPDMPRHDSQTSTAMCARLCDCLRLTSVVSGRHTPVRAYTSEARRRVPDLSRFPLLGLRRYLRTGPRRACHVWPEWRRRAKPRRPARRRTWPHGAGSVSAPHGACLAPSDSQIRAGHGGIQHVPLESTGGPAVPHGGR